MAGWCEVKNLQSLLPGNATPFERALEKASGERWADVPVHLIRDYKDPWTCPEHLLHFLAYERSVDIWDDDWSIARKSWVVENWPRLEREKGTRAGLVDFIALRGARLNRLVTPPAKTFLMPAYSDAERERYLARFPQLRTYPFASRGVARFASFAGGGGFGLAQTFVGAVHPFDMATRDRYRRETRLYEPRDGGETVLTTRVIERIGFDGTAVAFEEIALPPIASTKIHLGAAPKPRLFFGLAASAERIVSIRVDRPYGYAVGQVQYTAIQPGLTPIDLQPDLVAARGSRVAGQAFPRRGGAHLIGRYQPPSTAWQRLYERIYLFDPERAPDPRPRRSHLGATRLGMPPHVAEARVEIRGRRPSRAVARFVHGFPVAANPVPLEATLDAMNVAKRLSDQVLLDTTTRRTLRAGDPIRPGTTIGAIVAA